jgi:PAS domain S-box-containing protein
MQQESRKTILLVEDMAIIAMAEANILRHSGFDVIIAYNGNEAVKLASENSNIDLILMDIDLGKGIDGTEAAQIILKNQDVPIVFLSNHTEKEIVDKTEKITSYGYVVKNSGETVLLASIKMVFKLFEAHHKMRESEMKLIESDRKFHTLEKQIDDVIWTMDMNFRYTYVSPSVEKLNGYTVDEMMKLNLQDYLTEESSQKIINILAEEISSYLKNMIEENIFTIELEQIKKDRTIFLTEIKARFLLDMENNPIGIIGVTRDITQRLLSEKALRDSEKALNLALEGAQIGLWDQNFKTGIVNRSDHWATMLGYDPDEIKNDLDFWKSNIHPDDLEKTLDAAEKHERGLSEFYKVQQRLKCKNGNYKWVLNWGKISERDSDGQPVRALGIHVDIDDTIKAEEALRKSEYQFRTLFETTTLGIVYQDIDGKIISANSAAQEILGLTLDQMQGRSSFEPKWRSIHEDGSDFPGETHPATIAIKTGKTVANVTMGIFHPRKEDYVWIKVTAIPLFQNGDKNPYQVYATFEDISDHKKAEEALVNSENKLRSIFKAAPVGIGVTSNRVLLEVNDTMCKMLGYKKDELIGKSALMLYPTVEEFELVGKEKYKQIEQFGTGTVETKWVCKNGKIIDVLLSSTPLNISDVSSGVTFTVLDITGRKRSEEALRKSQERFALAQRSANIGSWEWDILTGDVNWSETIEPMFGFNKGEFDGTYEAYLKCIHPEDVGYMMERVNAAVYKNEEYKNLEFRIIWPNSTVRWMLVNGIVYSDDNVKPNRMIGIVQDITERKHAEENLKQSEENYRRFFDEDLSGVFLSTPEGGIKTCNQAYANMMEYKSTYELIHSNPVSHYPQSQQRIDFLNLLSTEKKLTNYEGEIVTKSGKHIQTLENVIGVFDDKNNLVEFWGYVNDITDRKKADQILKNAAAEKEALHRELLHRVKNSFNLIKSLMYLEREKLDNKEANKILENLEMRIGTLSKMYTLLNMSGISQHINLGEYLNQITKSLTESYVEDSDSIEIKSSFDEIEISPRDASSVGLIVNEILTNSLKYAFPDNKKGNISISLKAINGNIEIEISDNGVGVSDSFSLDDAKGMGLQLINLLTQQLSGTVTVEANNGTRFKIVFPLEQ